MFVVNYTKTQCDMVLKLKAATLQKIVTIRTNQLFLEKQKTKKMQENTCFNTCFLTKESVFNKRNEKTTKNVIH